MTSLPLLVRGCTRTQAPAWVCSFTLAVDVNRLARTHTLALSPCLLSLLCVAGGGVAGGEHLKYALMPDEYCFAALNLYIDIVTMIIILLVWLGGSAGSTSPNDDR